MSEESKVAVVTGASRGIGQAIALELAASGVTVIGTATTEQGAEKISAYFAEQGVNGCGLCLNVTDKQSIEQFMMEVNDKFGSPNILINNAGITKDELFLRMDDETWLDVIDTNLNSVYRLSKACVRAMFRSRWGRIVNIGSVVGFSGNPGQSNYTAAKAGLVGFSKSLAQEVASRGITVNVVAPGFIDTDMTKALPDMVKDEMKKRIPMKRLGQVEDIAKTVAFLVSDGAKYITGESIHVNGGMYMA